MSYVSYDCRAFFFHFAKSLLCFIDEITASFRRFGPLVVDWPHKAESKSYFPPKGNGLKMSPYLSEASPIEGILTSLEVDPLSLSKITLISLCEFHLERLPQECTVSDDPGFISSEIL